jgi:hypothetical protein
MLALPAIHQAAAIAWLQVLQLQLLAGFLQAFC